ncbi:MAG: VWA domain-containing protein [Clostridia bacterium]|nr:VWA domain-containing protein [Clostridia bacterium]
MRRSLIWAMVVSLLLGCFLGAASADTGTDNSATSGVDVIVVLDMSGSMTTLGKNANTGKDIPGNDINKFRIDATAMLVGMLDMDGSRVGIVPFAGTVLDGVTELTPVSTGKERSDLLKTLYAPRFYNSHADGTNTGAALMRALYMLDTRDDKSNRPMIVLMTDGKNALQNGLTSVNISPSYRWKNGKIEKMQKEDFTVTTMNETAREAADCASSMDVPIYTIGLTVDPTEPVSGGLSLADISARTGVEGEGKGWFFAEKADDAKKIPTFFASVLADKIGSSVQLISKPNPLGGNTYEVPIPVLNESIREINVILPVKKGKNSKLSGIDASSIRILDADGISQTAGRDDEVTILHHENGNFAMIKIRKFRRGSTGMWKLQFESDEDPKNISFNFLYNYNIKLNAALSTDRGDSTYYKSDKLQLSAYFADEDGNRSDDSALYADHTGEPDYKPWMTIKATWKLYQVVDGQTAAQPIRTGFMTPQDHPLQFGDEIDLSQDTPKSGKYKLVFTADGAGLIRTVEVDFELKNHEPVATKYEQQIDVNNPYGEEREKTWTVAGTSGVLNKKVGEIVTDDDPEDHTHMYFELEEVSDEAGVITMDPDRTLHFETKPDGNRIKDGKIIYNLKYDDGDTGGQGQVMIELTVFDMEKDLQTKYEPEMTITGTVAVNPADGKQFGDEEYTYKKNSEVKITVRLKNINDESYADEDLLKLLPNEIAIVNKTTGEPIIQTAKLELNGDTLEFTVPTTGNKEAEWTAAVKVGPFEGDGLTREIHIPNNYDPEADPAEELTINCSGDKVPGFLRSVFGEDTPDVQIKVSDLFKDKDKDKGLLDYSKPEFKSLEGEKVDPADITAVVLKDGESPEYKIQATGQQTSIFKYSYQCTMGITATDGDGRPGTYEQKITVVDLYNKMLTYLILVLAAILALVILFLIVHQARKPRFPQLNLTIREEPSLYESGTDTLSPVKTPTNVNAMGVDSDMAAKHGISMELLQNIIIKPIRSTLAVGVVCKKSIPGQEVTLDDVRLKAKKQYTWKIEQELTIHNDRSESMIVIKLENRRDDEPEDVLDDFGGSDDWSDDGAGANLSNAGKKRSKKVERKAKQAAEEDTFSGQNDDFDF